MKTNLQNAIRLNPSLIEIEGFIVRKIGDKEYLVIQSGRIKESKEFMLKKKFKGIEINMSLGYEDWDIDFLKDFVFIEHLNLVFQPLRKTAALNLLHNLRSFDLDSYFYEEIDFSNFPVLEECSLHWTPNAKNLFKHKRLRKLSIRYYKGKDLSEFSELDLIKSLAIINSPVSSLHGISALNSLKNLELSLLRNLESLDSIKNFISLEELIINTCKKIKSISDLEKMINLKKLYLINCGNIESLKVVRALISLEEFIFSESTNILDGDLSPLKKVGNLKKIIFKNRKHYNMRREEFWSLMERGQLKIDNMKTEFPEIIILCPNYSVKSSIYKLIKRELNKTHYDLSFYLTTSSDIIQHGLSGQILQKVK